MVVLSLFHWVSYPFFFSTQIDYSPHVGFICYLRILSHYFSFGLYFYSFTRLKDVPDMCLLVIGPTLSCNQQSLSVQFQCYSMVECSKSYRPTLKTLYLEPIYLISTLSTEFTGLRVSLVTLNHLKELTYKEVNEIRESCYRSQTFTEHKQIYIKSG